MPELADVEGYRRYLSRYAKGKRIEGIEAPSSGMTGNLGWSPRGDTDRHVHDRVVFLLAEGEELRYRNSTVAGRTAYWCPRHQRRR